MHFGRWISLPAALYRADVMYLSACFRVVPAVLSGSSTEVADHILSSRLPAIQRILDRLQEHGLGISAALRIVEANEAVTAARVAQLLREAPSRGLGKLFSASMREFDREMSERAYAAHSEPELQALHLALCNDVGGRWLTDLRAELRELHFCRWTCAARMRLGMQIIQTEDADEISCAARYRDGSGLCKHALDARGVHATSCAVGQMRNQRHNSLSMMLWRWMVQAEYAARREVNIPTWRRPHQGKMEQAVLDVVASCHPHLRTRYCDLRVRQLLAETYMPRSTRCPGAAALQAVLEKEQR